MSHIERLTRTLEELARAGDPPPGIQKELDHLKEKEATLEKLADILEGRPRRR